MKKILIVDDEAEIRELIRDFLIKENFKTEFACNGREALEKLADRQNNFDLVILDIMMPEIDGTEMIKILRKFSDVPVIFLTSKNEEIDKILGLEIGADDYITKPFNPREMIARVKTVLRRTYYKNPESPEDFEKKEKEKSLPYKSGQKLDKEKNVGTKHDASERTKTIRMTFKPNSALDKKKILNLEINTESYRVFLNGKEIKLTNKEYQLLLYLIRNKNIVISRESILENVWEYDFAGETRTVDVHIKELRKKIGDDSGKLIETIWKIGYRLNYEEDIKRILIEDSG